MKNFAIKFFTESRVIMDGQTCQLFTSMFSVIIYLKVIYENFKYKKIYLMSIFKTFHFLTTCKKSLTNLKFCK